MVLRTRYYTHLVLYNMTEKILIVNADDFGLTRGVNEGIVEAHRNGILTATTLMAEGPAFDHAVELARSSPSLDIGVHLVLWPEGKLPQRLPSFVWRAVRMRQAEIESLFERQVERVFQAGITPTHLDTHKHTHVFPHVFGAVLQVAQRFKISWIRRPLSGRETVAAGVRFTDNFLGWLDTGRLNRQSLARLLDRLQPGTTELMCHPGLCDSELQAAPTRLKRERQIELEALTAPEIRALLHERGVELRSFREL